MTIRAGVLSDTHLRVPDTRFRQQVQRCFEACDVIIHAGDITGPGVLEVFGDKPLYAVHGNMCEAAMRTLLPAKKIFELGGFTFGLAHGAGLGLDIEESLWHHFPEADCMIYGHTHHPSCHRYGRVLLLNPGSFRDTGHYGAPGTYAILEIGEQLHATLHEVPALP